MLQLESEVNTAFFTNFSHRDELCARLLLYHSQGWLGPWRKTGSGYRENAKAYPGITWKPGLDCFTLCLGRKKVMR